MNSSFSISKKSLYESDVFIEYHVGSSREVITLQFRVPRVRSKSFNGL